MFDKGRHDKHRQLDDQCRWRLRKGMAKVALSEQITGKPAVDSYGHPLRAHEMAQRHSMTQVERWARGWSGAVILKPSSRWCPTCKKLGRDPFQALEHDCDDLVSREADASV